MNAKVDFLLLCSIIGTGVLAFENPFTIINSTLIFSEPVTTKADLSTVDKNGYLTRFLPPVNQSCLKTFSLDVGVNRGRVTKDWLEKVPHMYIIGIEANHKLVQCFETNKVGEDGLGRVLLIPAAVSLKPGLATFNTGAGWENNVSDVGSLFSWTDQKRENLRLRSKEHKQVVRLLKLSDVLKHVAPPKPPYFFWDTLKIDIQGSDVSALISSEEYLANFMCVVGEFNFLHYNIPNDIPRDPAPMLLKYNFTKVQLPQKSENEVIISLF
jgi:FkbM family methyltransferase